MRCSAGDTVTARGRRWTVDETATFADCTVLSLSAAEPGDRPRTCRLLLPFDRPVTSSRAGKIRAVTRRRWMHQLCAHRAGLRVFGQLHGATAARIDILPFQLEPALALVTGRASRFLLADEVGLGKTIQAGMMIAELQRRGWCERALILAPAGLRRQWTDELQRRFDIRAAVVDATALSTLASSLPHGVNPWAVEPVAVTSIDFVKQPEVLRGLSAQLWDILVVDEAHHASAPSLRYEAVIALAGRSRHVALLTATPHAGDEAAYRSLCEIGRLDRSDPMLLFRRTRKAAGLPRTRRVHLLPVRLEPGAALMHRLLARYAARLWKIAQDTGRRDVQLVAMVLSKRAFSSACALGATVERRLGALSESPPAAAQWALPFDAETEPADEAPPPGAQAFDRSDEEVSALRELLDAARLAQADDRKVHALRRLLRRVREPVIVFTEYRDTLAALELAVSDLRSAATLHGGLTPQARRDAVDAFTTGAADLLLATDAGSEGLNLQSRCRLVINLELPWNPIRLEQRIGRVDRIGQTRIVHVINLFAEGTAESSVLAGLLRRVDRIHASEIEVAASVICGNAPPIRDASASVAVFTETVDLKAAARAEATRIGATRASHQTASRVDEDLIPVTLVRWQALKSLDREMGPCAIWFIRSRIANRAGRLVEDTLVPLALRLPGGTPPAKRRDVRAIAELLIEVCGRAVLERASQLAHERARVIGEESAEWVARGVRRENQLCGAGAAHVAPLVQAGLFDNRALQRQRRIELRQRDSLNECAARSALLEAGATAFLAREPQIALLLLAC